MVDDLAKKGKLNKCLSICDVSGSMEGSPKEVSVARGIPNGQVFQLFVQLLSGKIITITYTSTTQVSDLKRAVERECCCTGYILLYRGKDIANHVEKHVVDCVTAESTLIMSVKLLGGSRPPCCRQMVKAIGEMKNQLSRQQEQISELKHLTRVGEIRYEKSELNSRRLLLLETEWRSMRSSIASQAEKLNCGSSVNELESKMKHLQKELDEIREDMKAKNEENNEETKEKEQIPSNKKGGEESASEIKSFFKTLVPNTFVSLKLIGPDSFLPTMWTTTSPLEGGQKPSRTPAPPSVIRPPVSNEVKPEDESGGFLQRLGQIVETVLKKAECIFSGRIM